MIEYIQFAIMTTVKMITLEKCSTCKRKGKDHNGSDKSSYLIKHSIESGHDPVCHANFKILDKGYSNTFKRKVAEALLIKKHKPSLNVQEKSVKLELFN